MESLYTALENSPSPLSIKRLALKTGIKQKHVKDIMYKEEMNGKVIRVAPYKVGSSKTNLLVFCTPDNKFYC